ANGGIWKTSNFLTSSSGGPTWQPLTDTGPTSALEIGSFAFFPRNNDPDQTVVFATTGAGPDGTTGVGLLRSTDGGKNWRLLDSTNNVDASGNILPINDPGRDHLFVGTTGFKVIVDPKLNTAGEVIVYLAL